MQNVGVAVLILKSALPSPDYELALIPAICATMMTSMPWYLITPIYLAYNKWCAKVCGDNDLTISICFSLIFSNSLAQYLEIERLKDPGYDQSIALRCDVNRLVTLG